MNKSWTVLGAGYFIGDIIDNIKANGDKLKYLVVDRDLERAIVKKVTKPVTIIDMDGFTPKTDHYFLGHHKFLGPGSVICKFCRDNLLDKIGLPGKINKYNLKFANLIHPSAYIAKTVTLGQGNFFGAGSVVGPDTKIGDFNLVNRAAALGHDGNIGNHNHFGPGVIVCGLCSVGSDNFIGAGSVLIERTVIKTGITTGAGAVVVKDLFKKGIYVGVPAKKT